jgi:hypothetical protein
LICPPLVRNLEIKGKALLPNLPFFPNRGEGILECSNKTCKTPVGLFANQLKAGSSAIPKEALKQLG